MAAIWFKCLAFCEGKAECHSESLSVGPWLSQSQRKHSGRVWKECPDCQLDLLLRVRGSVDLQLYEGTVQEGEQLYWKMSMVRFGYDPSDADAWVEEPVTDKDDLNELEMDWAPTEAAD